MKNILDKLMIRSSDYVATVDVEDDNVLSKIYRIAKGMICAGKVGQDDLSGLEKIKVVKNIKQIDEDVFNKIIVIYSDEINLKSLVRIAEHLGHVLICEIPIDKKEIFENLLAQKAGIYETWDFAGDKKGCVDFLFKVRKY